MKIDKKKLSLLLGIPVSILFLYLAVQKIDIHETFSLLKTANLLFIFLAALATFIDLSLRAVRWKYLLDPIKKCKFIDLMSMVFIGFFANNTLPMRAGEIVRIVFVSEKENIPKTGAATTLALERLFDVFTILILVVITLFTYQYPHQIKSVLIAITGLLAFLFIFLYSLIYNKPLALSFLQKLLSFFPDKINKKITGMFHSFIEGLEILKQSHNLLKTIFISLLIWMFNASIFFLAARSIAITEVTYTGGIFIMAIIAIGISIPSSPAYVGVYEYFGILAGTALGVSENASMSFILLAHVIQFSVISTTGLFFLGREHISFMQLKNKAQEEIQ